MARGRILVIDDEKDLIELVRYNLEKEGFVVRSAQDGEAGLSAAKKELPDLILVDLMLPGIDGLDVCRSLRSDNRTARIPVIMLTAKGDTSDKVNGISEGADDYVVKPFEFDELLARIQMILRRTLENMSANPLTGLPGNQVITRQIEARIDQDAFISQQLSLWGQRGSQVIRGSLLAIPIEQSLLYVQPLYLAAEKGSLPELKRVIVAFGNQIAMEENLEASLAQLFGTGARPQTTPRVETAASAGPPGTAVLHTYR